MSRRNNNSAKHSEGVSTSEDISLIPRSLHRSIMLNRSEIEDRRRVSKYADSDYIYYNIIIPNNDSSNPTQQVVFAKYEENRVQPLLDNPSEWYMTVARWYADGAGIPLLIGDIQQWPQNAGSDPNLTTSSVTLSFNGADSQQYIIFVPSSKDSAVPPGPSAIHPEPYYTESGAYYWIYSYNAWLDMINTAFQAAYTALNLSVLLPGSEAPFLQYDPSTQLVSLVCQRAFYDKNLADAARIDIFFNDPILKYVDGLNFNGFGINATNGKSYQLVVEDLHNNWYNPPFVAPATPPDYYIFTQEINFLTYWSSVQSIVFTTGTIPIINEYVPQFNNMGSIVPGSDNFKAIITDYNLPASFGGDQRNILEYNPNGPYRIIDLNGTIPLTKIDIQMWWVDFFGHFYPMYTPHDQVTSIKLLFIKKSAYRPETSERGYI